MTTATLTRPAEVDTDDRRTPKALFEALNRRYDFCWDAAANSQNCLVHACGKALYFGPGSAWAADALTADWTKAVEVARALRILKRQTPVFFQNPPFSKDAGGIMAFVEKCQQEAIDHQIGTVMLFSADTSTAYFRYCMRHFPCWFTKRLTYENAARDKHGKKTPAKFGSMVVEIISPIDGMFWVG